MTLNEKIKVTEKKLLECKTEADEVKTYLQLTWLKEQKKKEIADIANGLENIMSNLKGCNYDYIEPIDEFMPIYGILNVSNDVYYYLEKAIGYLKEFNERYGD